MDVEVAEQVASCPCAREKSRVPQKTKLRFPTLPWKPFSHLQMDLVREVTTGMLDCGRSRLPYQIIPIASKGVLNILALSVHQEVSKFGFPKNYNQMKEVN